MKSLVLLLIVIILTSCGSGNATMEKTELPEDTIDIQSPPNDNYSVGRVYLSEIKRITVDGSAKLIIEGHLPESCSRLYTARLDFTSDSEATLDMRSWRPADQMCMQVLVKFTYIFDDIDDDRISSISYIEHNGEQKEIN